MQESDAEAHAAFRGVTEGGGESEARSSGSAATPSARAATPSARASTSPPADVAIDDEDFLEWVQQKDPEVYSRLQASGDALRAARDRFQRSSSESRRRGAKRPRAARSEEGATDEKEAKPREEGRGTGASSGAGEP